MPNPYISEITLPSGSVYSIKDSEARDLIAAINNWDYVVAHDAASTPYGVEWDDDGTTITGTLVASADTMYRIYLVPNDAGGDNGFAEYITVHESSTYSWEMFGSVEVPDLSNYVSKDEAGDLAYKDSASGSGTVSVPATFISTFTGGSGSVTVTGTTTGDVSLTKSNVTVSKASTGATTYTPEGSVSAPTISVSSAGATSTVANVTDVGSMPTYTVSNEVLTITGGAVPTTSNVTVKTGDASYTASTPTFTGTGARLITDSEVATAASFTGGSMTSTGTATASGTVSTTVASTSTETVNVTVS